MYGDEEFKSKHVPSYDYIAKGRQAIAQQAEEKMPAIIDTGSNNIGVPENIFNFLKEKWQKAIPEVNCIDDDNFCFVMSPCDKVGPKLQPVSF